MNLHYGSYLQLDKILQAQELESVKHGIPAHDEHLFIVIHQVYELWFKQILFELKSVQHLFEKVPLSETDLITILNRMNRCNSLWPIFMDQIKVMETMTPMDFLDFRHLLYPASGFQSLQFRLLETLLGLKEEQRSLEEKMYFNSRLNQEEKEHLKNAQKEKSLKDLLDAWLSRMPFVTDYQDVYWKKYQDQVHKHLKNDMETIQNHQFLNAEQKLQQIALLNKQLDSFKQLFDPIAYQVLLKKNEITLSQNALLCALFILLHRNEPLLQIPFKVIQSFIEFDTSLTSWRHAHSLLAQKMLGKKIGTGGSSGADYLLQTALRHRLFADFMNLSNFLLPSSFIPPLSLEIKEKLNFKY
jgi:tryptophan 2,3-dioxygenase